MQHFSLGILKLKKQKKKKWLLLEGQEKFGGQKDFRHTQEGHKTIFMLKSSNLVYFNTFEIILGVRKKYFGGKYPMLLPLGGEYLWCLE